MLKDIFKKLLGQTKILVKSFLGRFKIVVLNYREFGRNKIVDLINEIHKETELLLNYDEAYQLFMGIKSTEKIKGDIAEVGVYKGGSAKLICEAKGSRRLHLFDTFEGLPEVGQIDLPYLYKGKHSVSLESVKIYLKKYKNVFFHKGIFPDSGKSVEERRFSFVHLDVDIYKSNRECLKFFYPRMNKGGIIIIHDYLSSPGIKKSVDEFFRDRPEPVIMLSGLQCLIVKL